MVQQSLASLSSKVNSFSQLSLSANHVSNQQTAVLATHMQGSSTNSFPSSVSIVPTSSQNNVPPSNQSSSNSLQPLNSSINSSTISQ